MNSGRESHIIQGCITGCRIAQKELYDLYCASFFSICCRYTKDIQEAEQVLQDGFLKIFEKIDAYQSKGSFEGWMKKIMVNTCLDFLKSKMANVKKATLLFDTESYTPTLSVRNIGSDRLDQQYILSMIQKLPPMTRAVFNMYAIEGYSHKEIAEELNMSSGTSQWHVNQARTILKAGIEKVDTMEKKTKINIAFNNL